MRLIDRLINWCFTARQYTIGQFVPFCRGGETTWVTLEDDRRDAIHTMNTKHLAKFRNKVHSCCTESAIQMKLVGKKNLMIGNHIFRITDLQ